MIKATNATVWQVLNQSLSCRRFFIHTRYSGYLRHVTPDAPQSQSQSGHTMFNNACSIGLIFNLYNHTPSPQGMDKIPL